MRKPVFTIGPVFLPPVRLAGKLYYPGKRPVGLGQFIMLAAHGISERRLVVTLILMEAACGLAAIIIFARLK